MDPNQTLKEILILVDRIDALEENLHVIALANHVISLHTWLQNGGFLPDEWQRCKEAT
jgi:hypothetical protein